MLTPCRTCHRHVRSEEPTCPFCGSRLTTLLRSARNVAAAAALLSMGACGNDVVVEPRGADIYGGPPAELGDEPPADLSEEPSTDLGDEQNGRAAPMYGTPPDPSPDQPGESPQRDPREQAEDPEQEDPPEEPVPVPAYGGPRPPTE